MANQQAQPQVQRAIVKQVLSGDLIVLRGQPKGGPPPERTLALSNIVAPKLARRPTDPNADASVDEAYAWDAREYLRKKLVGRMVQFIVDVKLPSGREYGSIFLVEDGGTIETAENISESLIKEGFASVKRDAKSGIEKLIELEDAAKAAKKGRWGPPEQLQAHVRNIEWQVESPMVLVEKFDKKPIHAVIEHVRDGSTVRAFLLPDMYYITLMISGIKSPMFKIGEDGQPGNAEPFAEEAKYFTESRLLQRDVQIVLETVNHANFVGSIIHPNGDIAELLLKEGFAKCADWSIRSVAGGPARLRAAEAVAKEKKSKIWRDYVAKASTIPESDRQFTAKVVEIVMADALMIKRGDGPAQKIFLSSIRAPRLPEDKSGDARKKNIRPLYDIPYMFEAREFLRTKLIGKKVEVTLDYIQPAANQFPEKRCCTVLIGGLNVAELLVGKGLATVVRYRQDNDQRSSRYDDLLTAEAKAEKSLKGVHSKKEFTAQRVVELSGEATKAKTSLSSMKRMGRTDAIVEFVASGSRFRLYVKKDQSLLTFLLGGISCPRIGRAGGPGPSESEPYAEEAAQFVKDLTMQREVQVEFDTVDRNGNFIGWMFVEEKNLSVLLVEEGLSTVHSVAERSNYYDKLLSAEASAKKKHLRIWKDFDEKNQDRGDVVEEVVVEEKENVERKVNYQKVVLTEVTEELQIYVQSVDKGTELEGLMSQIRQEFASNPPLSGSFTPKRGEVCAAKFSYDGAWYRAKVEKILPGNKAQVCYMDYGNREEVSFSNCAALPSAYQTPAAYAREYGIAFAALPKDLEIRKEAVGELLQIAAEQELLLNVEYRTGNLEFVTLCVAETKKDIIKSLVGEGYLLAQPKREARFKQISNEFKEAENAARKAHLNMWVYGDITDDDAVEFGYAPRA